MENNSIQSKQNHRSEINKMGKKEYTLLKMQEYGFWPANLPTPYERQKNESKEDYINRKELLREYDKIAKQISDLYNEKDIINEELKNLKKQYNQTWDYEKIRKDVAQKIMEESIERRTKKKEQKEKEKRQVTKRWQKQKLENIVFIGDGYSGALSDKENNIEKLNNYNLPVIEDDKALAIFLEIEYKELRFLAYHRDVVIADHYYHYTIPKRNGKTRNIAAPKSLLKSVQRKILESILEKIEISNSTHGFRKERSIVSGANSHNKQPQLLINMDIENFFPTITYERVRGLFHSFGYSGYISSLLAMLCTYCERMPIEVKGQVKLVKSSERILPQGSPASPMITNIICRGLDKRIDELAIRYGFTYTRYADDLSFSFNHSIEENLVKKIIYEVQCSVYAEGFKINKDKTRYLKPHNRQCVTGIVINNEQVGVPKKWIKRMRSVIHHAEQLKQKGKLTSDKIYELSGMASWLQSVNPERYCKIIDSAKKVIN